MIDNESSSPLTLIVPSRKPWPEPKRAVETALAAAAEVDGDVILAVGHPSGAPDHSIEHVTVVQASDGDVFAARAAALDAAHGAIVAVLEDHCFAPPGWSKSLLAAWGRHPDADGLVTVMGNGAPSLLDRASFLLTWAPFIGPMPTVPLDRCPAPGAVSYRREVLQDRPGTGASAIGWLEYDLPISLRDSHRMAAADDVEMVHTQHLGWSAFALQYWAGRGYTGLGRDPSGTRRARVRQALRIPRILTRQTRVAVAANDRWGRGWLLSSVIAVMAICNGIGQVVGVLTGSPGSALERLE